MGRFFQTAEPQFLQDFIYKPPYEMLLAGLQKEQGDYNTALATANMYNNIDVNFIDDEKERERVRQIQDKWGNRTEELSRNIREADDWKKFMPELNKMSKELHQDYTTGELYTVQKSAENYAKMNEELAKIKDPAIKERAKQVFMDRWREKDRPVFESENIFDRRDLVTEYLKTKSKGEADKIAKAWANPGGGYIRSGEFTEEFINDTKKDFDNWLKQPENLAYMKQQDELLGLETYFDKDTGELISPDDPRSSAYHSKQHAISVADFNKQDRKANIGADPVSQFNQEMAFRKKQYADAQAAAKVENSAYTDRSKGSEFMTSEKQIQNVSQYNNFLDENFRKSLGLPTWNSRDKEKFLQGLKYKNSTNPQEKALYEQALKVKKMTNGQDVADELARKLNNLAGRKDADAVLARKILTEKLQIFNVNKVNYKGNKVENNWANLDRLINEPSITNSLKTEFKTLIETDPSLFNRANNAVVVDEDGNRLNKKGEKFNEFFARRQDISGSTKYDRDIHKELYINGSIGPLVNEGGLKYSDVEYEILGKDGKTYRVQIPFSEIKPDLTTKY
jgi:hypothetical protein